VGESSPAAAPITVGEITSGEATKLGGTEINLPVVYGSQDELLKAIFGPAAAVLGESLAADLRKSRMEELNPSETDNLRKHAETVRSQGEFSDKEPTRKQRENLFEWIDDASETDPESAPEEAAKWQAVLHEILSGNDKTSLDTLKSLNTYDIKAIHTLDEDGGALNDGQATKLISLGIVERGSALRHPMLIPSFLAGGTCLLLALNTDIIRLFFEDFGGEFRPTYGFMLLQLAVVGVGLVGLAGALWVRQSRFVYFTDLGCHIKRNIMRFLD